MFSAIYTLDQIDTIAKEILTIFSEHRIFCFKGDLGSGKTTLIEELCRNLGSRDDLSSPTFSIVNEYESKHGKIYHMDWYRLGSHEEAILAGIEDCLYSSDYCFIEWYQHAESLIPRPFIVVQIEHESSYSRSLKAEEIRI